MLPDAAHMIADRNEQLGQPIVPNGIAARFAIFKNVA
jgi:hypothetical protein